MARAKKKVVEMSRDLRIKEIFSDKAQRKLERELANYVLDLDERSQERYDYAQQILKVNDDTVREIVGWIVEELRKMEGEPKIVYKGQTYNAIKGEGDLLDRIQHRNFTWIAVRLLVACAEWQIRIGNFTLPSNNCARCGTQVRRRVSGNR